MVRQNGMVIHCALASCTAVGYKPFSSSCFRMRRSLSASMHLSQDLEISLCFIKSAAATQSNHPNSYEIEFSFPALAGVVEGMQSFFVEKNDSIPKPQITSETRMCVPFSDGRGTKITKNRIYIWRRQELILIFHELLRIFYFLVFLSARFHVENKSRKVRDERQGPNTAADDRAQIARHTVCTHTQTHRDAYVV